MWGPLAKVRLILQFPIHSKITSTDLILFSSLSLLLLSPPFSLVGLVPFQVTHFQIEIGLIHRLSYHLGLFARLLIFPSLSDPFPWYQSHLPQWVIFFISLPSPFHSSSQHTWFLRSWPHFPQWVIFIVSLAIHMSFLRSTLMIQIHQIRASLIRFFNSQLLSDHHIPYVMSLSIRHSIIFVGFGSSGFPIFRCISHDSILSEIV